MPATTHGGARKGAGAKPTKLTQRKGHETTIIIDGVKHIVTIELIEYVGRNKSKRIAYGVDQDGRAVTFEA